MRALIVALVLSQVVPVTGGQPIDVRDEGTRLSPWRSWAADCRGAGIACSVDGGVWTLTVAGGSSSGKVAEAYMADASITAQYLPITCSAGDFITCNGTSCSCGTPAGSGGKVAEAYMADASITAQTAGVAAIAYSADAGYYAHVARVTYAADASYLAYTAQVSQVAYSTDASYSAIVLAADPADCSAGTYATAINASGTLTCSTPAGTYTLPALTSTVLGGVKGTGTGTACTGTDKVTGFDGTGALTCGTDQTTGGGAYGTIQDEGTPLTQRATVNFIGSSVSCVDNAGSSRTDCTVSGGGGGSPGGVLGSLQFYSDAGVFAGMAGLGTDGTDLIFDDRATHATNPAAGTSVFYTFAHYGLNSPAQLQLGNAALGFDQHVSPFPFVRSDDSWWGCILPAAHGQTTYTVTGRAAAGTATGAAAAVAWASTDARTRQVWIQHPAAATANTSASYRSNIDYVWRGGGADQGGWLWWAAFAMPAVSTTTRVFVGLKDATATLTATADPNAALDTLYFGCNAADSNLSICSNDNVSTATCTTLGASFPCHTNNAAYDVALWAAANSGTIGYWIRHLTTGAEATGTVTSDLPRNTVQLNWEVLLNTGANATANTLHFGGSCWIANP